ncbi:RxLR effector protein [Phytophthora megakarya]|uniref:RxLR effector protein n=1 Tax=Phytophthora megakarya TaxID=4795 RepID=A0A225UXQ2_9STRA|nr:RxLR effector protein [Phytophthora megakarya]
MRLPFVMVVTLAALFGKDILASADRNSAKLSVMDIPAYHFAPRELNIGGDKTKRDLRVENTVNEFDDSEERAIPGLNKISEKLKPTTEKFKAQSVTKIEPITEKLTDKAMATAVQLKPVVETFSGKLKPIADKLIPILKLIAAELNTVPIVQRIVAKLKAFVEKVEKVKTNKIGEATVGEHYTMAKFENWFKQNKSPDDVKELLKVGTGPIVNVKDYDLWVQYSAFYKWAQRDKEIKAAKAAAT